MQQWIFHYLINLIIIYLDIVLLLVRKNYR